MKFEYKMIEVENDGYYGGLQVTLNNPSIYEGGWEFVQVIVTKSGIMRILMRISR